MSCDFQNERYLSMSFSHTHYFGYENMLEIHIPPKSTFFPKYTASFSLDHVR